MADIVIRSEKDASMDDYYQNVIYTPPGGNTARRAPGEKTLRDFSDMELVMELLARGFVLGKHIETTTK